MKIVGQLLESTFKRLHRQGGRVRFLVHCSLLILLIGNIEINVTDIQPAGRVIYIHIIQYIQFGLIEREKNPLRLVSENIVIVIVILVAIV